MGCVESVVRSARLDSHTVESPRCVSCDGDSMFVLVGEVRRYSCWNHVRCLTDGPHTPLAFVDSPYPGESNGEVSGVDWRGHITGSLYRLLDVVEDDVVYMLVVPSTGFTWRMWRDDWRVPVFGDDDVAARYAATCASDEVIVTMKVPVEELARLFTSLYMVVSTGAACDVYFAKSSRVASGAIPLPDPLIDVGYQTVGLGGWRTGSFRNVTIISPEPQELLGDLLRIVSDLRDNYMLIDLTSGRWETIESAQ
jgi:hypothetical protein